MYLDRCEMTKMWYVIVKRLVTKLKNMETKGRFNEMRCAIIVSEVV